MHLISLGHGSSLIIGTYDDQDTICFLSFHLLYIDLLLQLTKLTNITNVKYCDIDQTFGLHDYTVTVDLRNSKTSFINEIFRKVFTKTFDKDWVYFKLIESESDSRYFNQSCKFKGKAMYEW